MDNKNQIFYKIPTDYIYEVDEYELMTYIGILNFRTLSDPNKAYLSIKMICDNAGYSSADRRKASYYTFIRKHIHLFLGRKWITISNPIVGEKINPSECLEVVLSNSYIPKERFLKLTQKEYDIIINNHQYRNKASLLRVYLYIKSFMFVDNVDSRKSISAYYVAGDIAANTLGMSRSKYDSCVNSLCEIGLLVCRQTGSYYTYHGITNAPNIYVLNNENAENNISGAMSRLKYELLNKKFGNSDEFMPITYIGKPITKKNSNPINKNICEDDIDGDWGSPNPMNRY